MIMVSIQGKYGKGAKAQSPSSWPTNLIFTNCMLLCYVVMPGNVAEMGNYMASIFLHIWKQE